MDRKSIIVLAACFLLIFTWPILVKKFYPPKPLPVSTATNVVGGTLTNAAVTPSLAQAPTNVIPTPAVATTTSSAELPPEELLEFTNGVAHYTFTSHGGGLEMVELQPTDTLKRLKGTRGPAAVLNAHTPQPTMAILGLQGPGTDGIYNLTRTATGVRAEATLANGIKVVKDYIIGTNYLVTSRVTIENDTQQPVALPDQQWVVGTAAQMTPREDMMTVGTMWYNGSKVEDIADGWYANRTLGCIPGTPRSEYVGGQSNVVWAAAHNQFFAIALVPKDAAHALVARKVELPKPTGEDAALVATNALPPAGFISAFVYPATVLAPGQQFTREMTLFAGPKEYRRLARLGEEMKNNLDLIMGYGGFFGFFAKALLLAMNWFHDVIRLSYGWAIVAITIIVKLLFWPLTQASTRSMKRMQALQPQMKEIQTKYKDDPARMNRKMMEFMKEHKVSPLGGCLPMLLQIPVFFGFFQMIKSAIELRGAKFLWVSDLSQPDTLFMIPGLGIIPFIGIPGIGLPFNLLPLLMGATMLWQAHLTPPAPGMDPMQQKIMKYMPLMFMVFLYNFSAGLTLYWTVQNLLTILQTKLTAVRPETSAAPVPARDPGLTGKAKKRKQP